MVKDSFAGRRVCKTEGWTAAKDFFFLIFSNFCLAQGGCGGQPGDTQHLGLELVGGGHHSLHSGGEHPGSGLGV